MISQRAAIHLCNRALDLRPRRTSPNTMRMLTRLLHVQLAPRWETAVMPTDQRPEPIHVLPAPAAEHLRHQNRASLLVPPLSRRTQPGLVPRQPGGTHRSCGVRILPLEGRYRLTPVMKTTQPHEEAKPVASGHPLKHLLHARRQELQPHPLRDHRGIHHVTKQQMSPTAAPRRRLPPQHTQLRNQGIRQPQIRSNIREGEMISRLIQCKS
jgi:hypothetical protein